MNKLSKLLAVAIVILLASNITIATVLNNNFTNKCELILTTANIGVYGESNCTAPLTKINWGTVDPNRTYNYHAFIRNEDNTTIGLSMLTSNWKPQIAKRYITLTWNVSSCFTLEPAHVAMIIFYLHLGDIKATGDFSFTINIIGWQL